VTKTFIIKTLGCKVNQYESEAIANGLQQYGFEWRNINASFAIINTCTVTQKAGMQSRQLIRQTIRKHPDALIIVTGCHAQINSDDIQAIDGVHWIIGHAYKHELPFRINQYLTKKQKPDHPQKFISNILAHRSYNHMPLTHLQKRSRPAIKIQDGCNAFCSYCIVPYARGPARSLPLPDVVNMVVALKKNGYQEIILSGIHLGLYGHDFTPPIHLSHLLKALIHIPECPRIRLSSIEPLEITEELIQILQQNKHMCHHLHIPLQSGDNTLLKQMNRHYTRNFFQELVCQIYEQIPDVAIGIDVLVGFPTENDPAFENTLSLLKSLPAAYFHVFPFSMRTGTRIASQASPIDSKTIQARAKAVRELGIQKKKAFMQSCMGQKQWVLIESSLRDHSQGLTGNYIPVEIAGHYEKNQLVPVRLKHVLDCNKVTGEIINVETHGCAP